MSTAPFDAVGAARRLIRITRHGALATIETATTAPYASLVSTATDMDGVPIILISRLAVHTANIEANPVVSVLFAAVGRSDPMTHPRVSVLARAQKVEQPRIRRRFLSRHPDAALYVDFADFAFYRLQPERAHLVAGFGRIVDLTGAQLLTDLTAAADLVAMEEQALAHINEEHREATALYATALLGCEPGDWQMTGIDPDGCDLAWGDSTARLVFPEPVHSAADLRKRFQQLAAQARERV
jgi:putative heme iron utilization protein